MSAHISHSGGPAYGWLADEGQGQAGGEVWGVEGLNSPAQTMRVKRGPSEAFFKDGGDVVSRTKRGQRDHAAGR